MFLIEFIPWSDWMSRNCQAVSPGISRMKTVVCPDSRIMGTMMSLDKGTQETPPGNMGRPHLLNVASICFRSSSFTAYPPLPARKVRAHAQDVQAHNTAIQRHWVLYPLRTRTANRIPNSAKHG